MASNNMTFKIGGIVKTQKGIQVVINNVPEGNIDLLDDEKRTLVLTLFGERLEYTPDNLKFSNAEQKHIMWDIPIMDICSRHIEEVMPLASIGKENTQQIKELYRSNIENQKKRSIDVLYALVFCRPYLKRNGLAIIIDTIKSGSKPFEYIMRYTDKDGIHTLTIDISKSKYVWSSYLSRSKLCVKLSSDILAAVKDSGFDEVRFAG